MDYPIEKNKNKWNSNLIVNINWLGREIGADTYYECDIIISFYKELRERLVELPEAKPQEIEHNLILERTTNLNRLLTQHYRSGRRNSPNRYINMEEYLIEKNYLDKPVKHKKENSSNRWIGKLK